MIFFLDMDGVINTPRVCVSRPDHQRGNPHGWADPIAIGLLNRWIELSDQLAGEMFSTKIVLSSTWRSAHANSSSISQMLSFAGVDGWVHDDAVTRHTKADNNGQRDLRGHQIKDWLEAHPKETRWMIIDDDSDMLPEQKPRFIRTSGMDGITMQNWIDGEEIIKGIYDGVR